MTNKKPKLGISIMPSQKFLEACLPLFTEGEIEIIEWSFDTVLNQNQEPKWLPLMLQEYGNNNRLLGHGVYYSLLDARWSSRQEQWLAKLKQETLRYNYNQISEHFGLMSSKNAHDGFPLPTSLSKKTLQIGIDRLKRLQSAAELDVGVENLALAFNLSDIMNQGEFIFKLITPVNGFIILDLHNIYCQSENFGIDMMTIITSYPLALVKEIHISGGSWDNDSTLNKSIRRDTHDGRIPNEIFNILPKVLKLCPTLEYVIFEKIGNSFLTEKDNIEFREDFKKIKTIINTTDFQITPKKSTLLLDTLGTPLTDIELSLEQKKLRKNLKTNAPHNNHDFNSDMWKTAIKLYKKWNN